MHLNVNASILESVLEWIHYGTRTNCKLWIKNCAITTINEYTNVIAHIGTKCETQTTTDVQETVLYHQILLMTKFKMLAAVILNFSLPAILTQVSTAHIYTKFGTGTKSDIPEVVLLSDITNNNRLSYNCRQTTTTYVDNLNTKNYLRLTGHKQNKAQHQHARFSTGIRLFIYRT